MVVKDFRLYDENSSSKGRSPAAHIAQTSLACVAVPLIFAEINDSTPGGECQKKCLRDPLGVPHELEFV